MIYLSIDDQANATLHFHGSTPADYMIGGKSTARPLYTREQVDELIQKALANQNG